MKDVQIKLDDESIEILSKVESLHRESLINYGIRLVQNTEVFKVITGEEEAIVNSIDTLPQQDTPQREVINEVQQVEEKEPEVTIEW